MVPLLLLLAASFPPMDESVPNRQPQLAARGKQVAVTYGAGDTIYVATSADAGSTWTKPVPIAAGGKLALGRRRGPRIAISRGAIVISAIAGEKGRGVDGDLWVWRSADGGKTWSAGKAVNDVPASAREGLHAMAAGGNGTLFLAWLDLRSKGMKLYGAASLDGGATWSANRLLYASPSGSICECCHPAAFVDGQGRISVMFRNSWDGMRDMYLIQSDDGGKTFGEARKLGSGSWPLKGCPMDGGSLMVDPAGRTTAVWRREGGIYRSGAGGQEELLGQGRQPVVAATPRGAVIAWTEETAVRWTSTEDPTVRTLPGEASFLSLAALPGGTVLVAGERAGSVFIETLH